MNDSIPNKGKFNLPEGYFASFQERLDAEIQLQELLGDNKHTGFTVPEQYFEQAQDRFIASTQQTPKVIQLRPKRWLWVAASIAILITIGINFGTGRDEQSDFAAMEDYITLDDTNLSALELATLLDDEEFNTLSLELLPDDDSYIEYLNESTEIYDLIIE